MTNGKLMTKNEIIEMQREVLKRRGSKYRVVIPYEVIDYLENAKHSNTWKGKYILLYMGVYLAYREAYFTYRRRAMNINNIMQLMNLNPENRELSSEFSKNGFLAKEKIITHVNDLPVSYSKEWLEHEKRYEITYNTAKDIIKEDRPTVFENFNKRQLRSIEPTLNIKGKTRVRGRGTQVLKEPVDSCRKNTISFSYDTIQKVVCGRLTENDLWALVTLKRMTGNKTMLLNDKFQVSKKLLGSILGISESGYRKIHDNLRKELDGKYGLNQQTYMTKQGELASKVYLIIEQDI